MNGQLYGLTTINIELTSRCNKKCWMCGRRRIERDYPELVLEYGDIEFSLIADIAIQLPPRVIVQLHNNGEALLYPRFGDAVRQFNKQITNVVTNGKLLVEKSNEIIDNLDTLAISIIERDPEANEQYNIIEEFIRIKGKRKPQTILRLNGNIDKDRYRKLGLTMATRNIHSALGSFNYERQNPTIPEVGICLDFLNHPAINNKGKMSICVRFDPKGLGVIGDVNKQSIHEIWNSSKRLGWLNSHKLGRRDLIPLCSYCHFWGVPTGWGCEARIGKLDEKAVFGEQREK